MYTSIVVKSTVEGGSHEVFNERNFHLFLTTIFGEKKLFGWYYIVKKFSEVN